MRKNKTEGVDGALLDAMGVVIKIALRCLSHSDAAICQLRAFYLKFNTTDPHPHVRVARRLSFETDDPDDDDDINTPRNTADAIK